MAIARDASSPAAFFTHPGSSMTSASFTPPNNSLLVLKISVNDGSAPAMTVSNTGTGVGTWSLSVSKTSGAFSGANSTIYIYEAQVSTGSAITVSASFSGFSDIDGYVDVWTGANSSQSGAASATGAPTGFPVTPVNPTVTTTAANSQVIGLAVCDDSAAAMTSTDSGSGLQATNIADFSAYKAATTPSGGTSVAVNFGSGGSPSNLLYALLEILAPASAPILMGGICL